MHESLTQSLTVLISRGLGLLQHELKLPSLISLGIPLFSKDERGSKQSGPSQGWHSTAFGGGSQSALLQSDPNSVGWKLADIQLGTLGAVRKRHRQHPKIAIFSSWLILYPPLAPWLPLLN
jgi:hypothetical protein